MSTYRYRVHVTFPDGATLPAGTLVADEAGRGVFRYDGAYLGEPRAFALHPAGGAGRRNACGDVGLPLEVGVFRTSHPSGLFPVFKDMVPEGWGKTMLMRRHGLRPGQATLARLLGCLGRDALGALAIAGEDDRPPPAALSVHHLHELVDTAHRFINGEPVRDEALRLLFMAGSSPGGGRPKAIVCGDDGVEWLAKFPHPRDTLPVVRIEAAMLELARRAGLTVAPWRLRALGAVEVLLVRRFDLTPAGGRCHLLSLRGLLGGDDDSGYGYADVSDALRRYSVRPDQDVTAVVRLMLFNLAITNTDDHLRNISVLRDADGWRLAPAYDLVPGRANTFDGMGGGAPHFHHIRILDDDCPVPGRELLAAAARFGVTRPTMARLIDEVAAAVADHAQVLEQAGVPEREAALLSSDIHAATLNLKS